MDCAQTKILKNDKWINIDFMQLKKGDNFQLINPDGSYHTDKYGKTDWVASSNPYLNEDGIPQIDIL